MAEVIRRVAAGARYVDPGAADALSDERSPLTDRELDVSGRPARRDDRTDRAHPLTRTGNRAQPHLGRAREAARGTTRQQAVLVAERGWI